MVTASPHDAIPLSLSTIFGAACASTLIASRRTHPIRTHRPLVDMGALLLLAPVGLTGEPGCTALAGGPLSLGRTSACVHIPNHGHGSARIDPAAATCCTVRQAW